MTTGEYCCFPPRLAADVEIVSRNDGDRLAFIAGSATVGRYLMLGAAEHRILQLLDGTRPTDSVGPQVRNLTSFLTKLDEVGILARDGACPRRQLAHLGNEKYVRFQLFNPEALFARIIGRLRWIWTRASFVSSALFLAAVAVATLLDWPEFSRYSALALRQHYAAILVFAWAIGISHEFAHGLTAKAFGGRATEIGVLLIYYCLPGLYCNVSGLHLIPRRGQRLWVIAAGVYWQALVGAVALAGWLVLDPQSGLGQLAMVFGLGSLLNLVFNANPLIKLDGYYFLSQWLGIPNLMDRSRAVWKGLLAGGCPRTQFSRRERRILLIFGALSFLYNLALPMAILWYAAQYLMDRFQSAGLLVSLLLAGVYAWRPLKKMLARGGEMNNQEQKRKSGWRRLLPALLPACLTAVLCLPWNASVGSYGTLTAIPGREAVLRAPDDGTLLTLQAQPGQHLVQGAAIGVMGNLDLEERIAQIRTEIARSHADAARIAGELHTEETAESSSKTRLAQRRRELTELESEQEQIRKGEHPPDRPAFTQASYASDPPSGLPASLAALQADVQDLNAKAAQARQERDRNRELYALRLVSRRELESADAKSESAGFNADAARQRLLAAITEHGRRQEGARTEFNLAQADLAGANAQTAKLDGELAGAQGLGATLEQQLALMERKRARFVLAAPLAGTLFGDDLPRASGQYFTKGAEICRIADTRQLQVRLQVPEQAVGDIAVGYPVRVKTRAFPDRIFQGTVSNIGGESEVDANGQRTYRVELAIQNGDALLRPGMTVFARIDFGHHSVAWLMLHKLKQELRPEMWML